ncbi:MAG: aminotransferase class I/II-fold pyridoxal phosphate-dependent enzyme [Clostridiales bacterium]|nr:aminotransferase class I/II-fold pyridoxal phosphate-dependent enzyme [Clostridiales bacterium]MBS5877218.1 aminotransferase class I/II-fold pyridoxal phosphate-dependent enzyme [Clostridiales bacterium]MDU1041923.1 aminotransferase class I/II-fold pyridoxal phosphate-dependent enzyme [Clostridiales bacterium]MDU3490422.1 aminotransferase class I/II-fold pyridoxal phosphate-dependent enzyme [Clostridiales bacterium]
MLYTEMSKDELTALRSDLENKYNDFAAENLKLDMSRGKPSPAQLKISYPMLSIIDENSDLHAADGTDCSNYGCLEGIKDAKELIAGMLKTKPENVIVFGSASLSIMFDQISRAFTHGYLGEAPWSKLDKVKFLCPVPGYDRHFTITEHFGIEMINIPMTGSGPDMDLVEKLVVSDPSVKGIWCVPKYSNPSGCSYSDETVKRLASLKPAARDFRIFYDNAYCVHDLYDKKDQILEILEECEKAGNPNIVFEFCSTSKISFPGAGISGLAASPANLADIKDHMKFQTISHDKINQLRHARFFKNIDGIKAHMKKHADHIRPKFELVLELLEKELGGLGIGRWTKPNGGYFISFDTIPGCADKVFEICKNAGVTLTNVGATFPYGKDPENSNLRIAPTFPTLEELAKATELFCLAVKKASVEKLLGLN